MPPSWSIVSPARSASRRQLVKIRQPPAGQDPPAAGHGSRFQIRRPAGQDPPPCWSRSAAQIRQPLVKIRRQLVAFFVLGPQHIGSKNTVFDLVRATGEPRPAVVQTLARAMFRTNIYVKNRTMFHVKQCTINRQKTEFLLTAQKPCILCT